MSFSEAVRDYDYLITDSRGMRKVIDGVEYPATKDDLPKKHQDSGCTECTFVGDQKTILAFKVDRQLRQTVEYDQVFVGKFTMPGWVGHSGFYLFKCQSCESVVVDYPHGYYGELLYLKCSCCQTDLVLVQKEIYKREGVHIPLLVRLNSMSWGKKRKVIGRLVKRVERKLES